MKTVGLRELRNRLSEYVRRARSGETVLVKDRGQVVAEIRTPGTVLTEQGGIHSMLFALSRNGLVTIGATNKPEIYPQLTPAFKRHSAAELLDHERSDR
jgi:antitoxin (DNA-binding transcriptional repressor) of toxin-antitoxin stability system